MRENVFQIQLRGKYNYKRVHWQVRPYELNYKFLYYNKNTLPNIIFKDLMKTSH